MQKSAPLNSMGDTAASPASQPPARIRTPSRTHSRGTARFFGLVLVSAFSLVAWVLIFRLVLSLIHG